MKKEFSDFGTALAKSQKKYEELGAGIETMARRIRVMERKLKGLEEIEESVDGRTFIE